MGTGTGEIRTHTLSCLRRLPLPLGYDAKILIVMALYGIEPHIPKARGLQPRSDPTLKQRRVVFKSGNSKADDRKLPLSRFRFPKGTDRNRTRTF